MNAHLTNLKNSLEYIIDHEKDDYEQWCEDNDYVKRNYEDNTQHVFASATLAWNIYFD